MYSIRMATPGTKLGDGNAQLGIPSDLFADGRHYLLIRLPLLAGHLVIKLTDERHDRHLPQDGTVPIPFNGYGELAVVLLDVDFFRVIPVTLQEIKISGIHVRAGNAEESFLRACQL